METGVPQRIRDEAKAADEALNQLVEASPAPPAANDAPPDQPPAPPDQPPAPPPAQMPAGELERLMQAHRTLQGMFNKQQSELQETKGRIAQLSEMTQRAPEPAAPPPRQSLVSDEEVKDFGEDLISVIRRAAKEEFLPSVNNLLRRVELLEGRAGQTEQVAQQAQQTLQMSAEQRFESDLTAKVPNWTEVNEMQGFLDWLEKPDKYSRQKKMSLLQQAYNRLDADTVSSFFADYLAESGQSGLPASDAAKDALNPTNPTPPPFDPQSLIAPSSVAGGNATTENPGGRVWRTSEVTQVYDDHMQKRLSPERFAALEREIFQATAEGRVRD